MNPDFAEQFNRHENRHDGAKVAGSLTGGLAILRESLFLRVHRDVERLVGRDSMLIPVSEVKTEQVTKTEIDLYQIAESAAAVRDHGYVGTSDDWYARWLARLRLGEAKTDGEIVERIGQYLGQAADDRRLAFTDVLVKVLPEAQRAPLVVFRLLPFCVRIATALAFGDQQTASGARKRQVTLLPAITDCRRCRAELLENGEQCRECGNPLWKSEWLTAAD